MYNNKHIKANINLHNTKFYGDKALIESEHCTCLSVILLDSIVHVDKKFHLQIFLNKCKYAIKKKKIMSKIHEELKLDEFDDDKYDDEYVCPFKC